MPLDIEGLSHWFHWSVLSGILDVLVVSFLIYRILLLVKGTRALPMMAGLVMLLIVYLVSGEIGLVTLNWILGNFLGSLILIIVVLFQDDLRRALIKMGLGPGLGRSRFELFEDSLAEVARTAGVLAPRRIGALMVISRDVGLNDYREEAVEIDAVVSHQLLVSIFHPTSPIHDGAVIVEGDRIVSAGAVLPLTFNPSISQELGTRHRAALGLSEKTDALIVVVSEETGTISLVRDGRITRDLTEKTLHNALRRLMMVKQTRKRKPQPAPVEEKPAKGKEPAKEVAKEAAAQPAQETKVEDASVTTN